MTCNWPSDVAERSESDAVMYLRMSAAAADPALSGSRGSPHVIKLVTVRIQQVRVLARGTRR